MDRRTIDAWFELLEAKLAEHPLPTEAGGTRLARADEFMLMHEQATPDGRVVGFKHRDTRNYVFLIACMGEVTLHVPITDQPFRRGFFDVFELLMPVGGCAPCGCACEAEADPRND